MSSATVYRIDSLDSIVSVDRSWGEFADRNGAPDLRADRVVGHRLPEFVTGPEVETWPVVLATFFGTFVWSEIWHYYSHVAMHSPYLSAIHRYHHKPSLRASRNQCPAQRRRGFGLQPSLG